MYLRMEGRKPRQLYRDEKHPDTQVDSAAIELTWPYQSPNSHRKERANKAHRWLGTYRLENRCNELQRSLPHLSLLL